MSEPPQPSWQGNQPDDPTAPTPPSSAPPSSAPPPSGPPAPGPPPSGPPAPGPPSSGGPAFSQPAPYPPPPPYGQPGPYPPPPAFGQPDPYAGQPPPPGYGQPDPYAGQPPPPAYGQPDPYAAPPPGYPGQPYPGAPVYPGAIPPKKSNAGKIALIIGGIVLVLLCICAGMVVWLLNIAGDEIGEAIEQLPSSAATAPVDPTGAAPGNAQSFDKGDCVTKGGTTEAELTKVTCPAGTHEVAAKIPFSTDRTLCDSDILGAGQDNWTEAVIYDQTPGVEADYVLCLRQR